MSDQVKCAVWVSEAPHYFHQHRCTKSASHIVQYVPLCGTHYNQLVRRGRLVLENRVLRLTEVAL